MFIAFPALIQAQGGEVSPIIPSPIESEAREFMDDYADDLRAGRRQSIADRYDKRGAYRVGEGQKILETQESIRSNYLNGWAPPATFRWRELSFEPLSSDAIVVTGFFDWGTSPGKKLAFSYTNLLVRQDGRLKIRLEDESADPKAVSQPRPKGSGRN
jgi:hypothetical protein